MSTGSLLPTLTILSKWEELFDFPGRARLEEILPDYLRRERWFGSKTKTIRTASLHTIIPVTTPLPEGWVRQNPQRKFYYNLIQVRYLEGSPELYALPLAFISAEQGERLLEKDPQVIVARLEGSVRGFLCDALVEESFATVFLNAMAGSRIFGPGVGNRPMRLADYEALRNQGPLAPRITGLEQSNTSIIFGDRLILKCYRRLEEGENLDLEIGSFLTEAGFLHIAPVVGALEFQGDTTSEAITLAILHAFVPNQGDAWQSTLTLLGNFYDAIQSKAASKPDLPLVHLLDLAEMEEPATVRDNLRQALGAASLLGRRTAELHLALAKGREPAFAPEPFTSAEQQALFQGLCELHGRVFDLLRGRLADLPDGVREEARLVLERSSEIPALLKPIVAGAMTGQRIRCHGDYHLGQVLFTGQDFVIIDFEGEPARPLRDRRLKASPLRDVAGMIRSFHYAAHSGLLPTKPGLEPWARFWYCWTSAAFLRAYLATAGGADFLPVSRPELKLLLDTFLLEKAMYELCYELNHRPDWVRIPLRGIGQLLGES